MLQTAEKKQKIGLLGGTFDPVHNGHLAVANHILNTLKLDSIWIIPASQPPHKDIHGDGLNISSFSDRLAMLEIAIGDNNSLIISDIESKRTTPSYSIDTIKILLQQLEEQVDLYFVIGVDAFIEIDTWKRFKELPGLVNFAIISRPAYPPDRAGEIIIRNFPEYKYNPDQQTWSSPSSKGVFILQHMEPVPISSTEIRDKVRKAEDITSFVPKGVENYIKQQGLYK